ncbi:MAG: DNA-binding transcriptional regulator [Bacteroidales bacterium]|nr:DNA-binding transcriptional regulator [Bacteroidales bacterium]
MRLLFITDFTEQFAYRLLRGVMQYAEQTEPWVVCKMPPAYKHKVGLDGVVEWAKQWKADVVIGQFDPQDDVTVFRREGIVAMAQDYIKKFDSIPNITADYDQTGEIVARRFLSRGFKNFAFFGYRDVCWSDERCNGFRKRINEAGFGDSFSLYNEQRIDALWAYDLPMLQEWLQSLPKPVAIMACDDNQGSILIQACNSFGIKIPGEVAIMGVDNDEVLCNMSNPALTSVNIDIEGGGYIAAKMAERMTKDPSYLGEDVILRPLSIVPRMSSNIFATKDSAILTALQYIGANVDHKILVEDVLRQVPLSRRLLEQRFLKVTGTTIYRYISELRMNRFAELLLSSKDSIANIAARLDEPDTKSISRRFQAIKGCTPSEFRRRELRKLGA